MWLKMIKIDFFKVLADHNPDAVTLDGLDNAIIGISYDGKVVYSAEKIIQELMVMNQWSRALAQEWADFNTFHKGYGEHSPVICHMVEDM